MSETLANQNIYDKNGILLLAKGQKITEAVIEKHKKVENDAPDVSVNFDIKQREVLSSIVKAFEERMNIRDDHVLKYPKKILSAIIFESKTQPWWIHVNGLSNYVDWLYAHSIDVAIISLMIAVELKCSDEELWNIGLGALLHDIGKLLIPKSIIQNPGPLSDAEMAYIRKHCELGMSCFEPCCLPKECIDIVLQHHERLDGSGYPKGLKEDEICRNAKIVMIADVVDAITSDRPYKSPQEMDAAIKILISEDRKFSRKLVSVLEKILK